jgi:hypothetical protein
VASNTWRLRLAATTLPSTSRLAARHTSATTARPALARVIRARVSRSSASVRTVAMLGATAASRSCAAMCFRRRQVGCAHVAGDEGVEHAVAEDALQPQARLHAALAVDGHQRASTGVPRMSKRSRSPTCRPSWSASRSSIATSGSPAVVLRPPGAAVDDHVVEIAGAVAELVLVACLAGALAVGAVAQGLAIDPRQAAQHQRRGAAGVAGRAWRPGCRDSSGICSVCTS